MIFELDNIGFQALWVKPWNSLTDSKKRNYFVATHTSCGVPIMAINDSVAYEVPGVYKTADECRRMKDLAKKSEDEQLEQMTRTKALCANRRTARLYEEFARRSALKSRPAARVPS